MHALAAHLTGASMHVVSGLPATPPINLEGPTNVAIHYKWFLLTAANFTMICLVIAVFLFGIFVPYRGNKKIVAAARAEAAGSSAPASPTVADSAPADTAPASGGESA